MGNPYRNMTKRNLTWRFFHEVEENSEAFPIDIDESESVSELGKENQRKNLQFWKVNISNSDVDKFSSLRLQNDEKEGFTHVIFTSNYLINQNLKEKIKELTENLENIHFSFEEGMDNFGRLSEMLTTLKKNKSRAENSILQLAYSEKIVSKGDDILYNNIKITTLKVAEEWAYIEYENEYFTSITKFIKEKENITYPPVPEQRDLFAIGNRSYQDIRRILGSKEGVSYNNLITTSLENVKEPFTQIPIKESDPSEIMIIENIAVNWTLFPTYVSSKLHDGVNLFSIPLKVETKDGKLLSIQLTRPTWT
ncbi:19174_t:CDS:2 [Rhizophagus irregularis]|nr:19174_t:CDS:2 [Rhizophagus irregularis]